jgi:hypothetical protein
LARRAAWLNVVGPAMVRRRILSVRTRRPAARSVWRSRGNRRTVVSTMLV